MMSLKHVKAMIMKYDKKSDTGQRIWNGSDQMRATKGISEIQGATSKNADSKVWKQLTTEVWWNSDTGEKFRDWRC